MQTVDAAGLRIGDEYPPRIMGVLNVSEESPYDPSVFADPGDAAAYVDERLIDEGADIVDVGLESANRRFEVMGPEEERMRLETAVETIESTSGDAVFSIETRYHEVAEAALDAGFDMVNDICGFADPTMAEVCAERDVAVGKMASPADLERPGAVEEIDWPSRRSSAWAEQADYVDMLYEALKHNGLTDKTIVDPAFGGWSETKTLVDDRATFERLREFRSLGQPILVSINRKNFLRAIADRSTEAALPVSLAATSMAVERGAHVLRTHDVAGTRDAALVGDTFTRGRTRETVDGVAVEELDVTTPEELARHADRLGVECDPGEAVVRTFELRGLDTSDHRQLSGLAADCGVVVATDGETTLLGGAPAALDHVAEAATDRLGTVCAVLSTKQR